jgi:hypothetical protein
MHFSGQCNRLDDAALTTFFGANFSSLFSGCQKGYCPKVFVRGYFQSLNQSNGTFVLDGKKTVPVFICRYRGQLILPAAAA